MLYTIAEAQKHGGIAAFIDAEHALDPSYAKALGVNIDDLLISQPDTGEQALEICDYLVKSGAVDVIVIDSVAALVPEAEIKGEMGKDVIGLQARLISQALRKLTATVSKAKTIVIFINQLREKIGNTYGNLETTTGGRALKFYSSIRLEVRRSGQIKEGSEVIGYNTNIRIVKNKVAPPFKDVMCNLYFSEGISKEADLINLGVKHNVISKTANSWYSFGDEHIGHGFEHTRKYFEEEPIHC